MSSGFDLTLSFDNGPEPEVTPAVLDVLRERAIKATFFVVGEKLAAARHAVARARAEGHWIGNHTWSHGAPLGTRTEADLAAREIVCTDEALGELATQPRLFRPNGGGGLLGPHLLREDVATHLCQGGYTVVLWHAVPRDFAEPDAWVGRALTQCSERPWTLMVLHDLPNGAMRHLPRFLDAASAAGARFRQDFPPDCLPIIDGRFTVPPASIVTYPQENAHA